jgi:hypothetical protein
MWTAASVLACALSVLGRSESSMPPIQLIDVAPPGSSVGAEAFVRSGTIYVITSSSVFQSALSSRVGCSASNAFRKLASILAHEQWHVRHGPDEKGAYQHQLITLIQLGLHPGSSVYHDVQTSMLRIVALRKRNGPEPNGPEHLLARITPF